MVSYDRGKHGIQPLVIVRIEPIKIRVVACYTNDKCRVTLLCDIFIDFEFKVFIIYHKHDCL